MWVSLWEESKTKIGLHLTLLFTSLNFFFTPLLALLLMFPGLEIQKQSGMASGPLGVSLPPTGMPCLEASGKVILFSFWRLLWKLASLIFTKICSFMMLILAVVVMTMLIVCVCVCACVRAYVCVCNCCKIVWRNFLHGCMYRHFVCLCLHLGFSAAHLWVLFFCKFVSLFLVYVRLGLWTSMILCGNYYMLYINFHSFIHPVICTVEPLM